MSLNYTRLKIGLIVCLAFGCQTLSAQPASADNTLINFEKSLEQGKINEIERPLLSYAVAHPNEPKAIELLAQVRFRQGRLEEAKGLFQRSLVLNPNFVSSKIRLGRIAYLMGQKEESRAILEAVSLPPTAPTDLQMELATALFFIGDFQNALAITEKLPLKVKNSEALSLIAAIYLESGSPQKIAPLIPLMKKSAANPVWAVQYAEVLNNAGMNRDATDILRTALVASPANVNVLVQLGRAEIYARDFANARQHLEQANKLQPRSAEILSALATLESTQGNLAAAFDLLNNARQISPDSTVVLADFVILAIRSNKTQAAVEAAKTLVALNPDNAEYKYLLGAALLQNGNVPLAQQTLEAFMQQRPNDSRGCLALGLTLAAQRDKIESARTQLIHCLQIDPKNYEAKYQLGLSYKAQGETAKAIQYFEDAARLAPNYPLVLRDLGSLYLQTNAEAKAQIVLEKAVALDPNDADTHFQLSRLYTLTGKSDLSKKHLELFQKLRNGGKVSP